MKLIQILKSPKVLIVIILLITSITIIFGDPIILDKMFSNLENIYKLLELIGLYFAGRKGFEWLNRKQEQRNNDNDDTTEN